MQTQVSSAGRRRPCPQCGGIEMRTLRVCGGAKRHHQCLACAGRYVSEAPRDAGHDDPSSHDTTPSLALLPVDDQDVVHTLIQLTLGAGTLVGEVEVSPQSIAELRAQHGPPSITSRGMAFPVYAWRTAQTLRYSWQLIAIDQGTWRVCFHMRRPIPASG